MRSKFKWIFTLLVALSMQFSFAQEKTVTGTITDGKLPLPGANVVIKGTTKGGVSADADGKYAIKAKAGDVLVFSFLGFDNKSVTVGAANSYNVSLKENAKVLDEVVITQGYRTVTKKNAVVASSIVNAKTIENRPNVNAISTLQGQLAGVNITSGSGQPGSAPTVLIRGLGTVTGSSDPLYVIDGFPSYNDAFRNLNPNDIASAEVLKDAAAIAEYGSRGSNGVIVIKTKKGGFGDAKTTFRYSTQYGVSELQKPGFTYANARELLTLESIKGVGLGSTLTPAEIAAYNINTDWTKVFFSPSNTINHNLSIENTNKNIGTFTSVSFTDQDGLLPNSDLKRFTVRNNLNGKSANDKVKFLLNTAVGFTKNNEPTNLGGGAINRNFVTGAFLGAPYISPDIYTGSDSAWEYFNNTPGFLSTPILLLDNAATFRNYIEEARVDVSSDLNYKLAKNVVVGIRNGGLLINTRTLTAQFPNNWNSLFFSGTPGVSSLAGGNFNGFDDIGNRREFNFSNLLYARFDKKIKKHSFNASINGEYNFAQLASDSQRRNGLDPIVWEFNSGVGFINDTAANDLYVPTNVVATRLRNDLISYFGSLDYDFDSKFGIAISARRDWSSRFIKERQAGNFFSIGGRVNLDEFLKDFSKLNVLKLRGSLGTIGNQRLEDGTIFTGINPPRFATTYSTLTGAGNAYNGNPSQGLNLGYPDLRWETTKTYNIGLDLEMFKSRLRANVDYYSRATTDQFLSAPISAASGANNLTRNTEATVFNKGLELNLQVDVIKTDNMTLTLRGNGSTNKNYIDDIENDTGEIFVTSANGITYVHRNGQPTYQPFLYRYAGVNPTNGEMQYLDINGNITTTPTASDRRAVGKNFIPKYQGGFGFDFDYKGLFVSTLFSYVFDVVRYDFDYLNALDSSTNQIGQFNVSNELLNAWTPTNTNTDIPALDASNALQENSDRFLRDASYIRLRNLQVGYRLPNKYLKDTFFKDLSFNVTAENLFTITKWKGFDAESDRLEDVYQYPTARIITFGLDVKF
jgi:TonB-dependent starch-binding outer membrane protein SusC